MYNNIYIIYGGDNMNPCDEIAEILEKENIKYKKEELEKVVRYAEELYVGITKGSVTMK